MKLKSYIFQIALAAAGVGVLGACEDMLEPTSEYVMYDDDHLNSPSDTASSLIGLIYKLEAIGDRTNLLGEVRGDLVTVRNSADADLQDLADFNVTDENKYNDPRDYYAIINNCNYYITHADMNAYDNRGNQIFLKEMAQVKAIGYAIPGINESHLYQYRHLGDAVTKTDVSGVGGGIPFLGHSLAEIGIGLILHV